MPQTEILATPLMWSMKMQMIFSERG